MSPYRQMNRQPENIMPPVMAFTGAQAKNIVLILLLWFVYTTLHDAVGLILLLQLDINCSLDKHKSGTFYEKLTCVTQTAVASY